MGATWRVCFSRRESFSMAAWISVYLEVRHILSKLFELAYLCKPLGLGNLGVGLLGVVPLGLERRIRHGHSCFLIWSVGGVFVAFRIIGSWRGGFAVKHELESWDRLFVVGCGWWCLPPAQPQPRPTSVWPCLLLHKAGPEAEAWE